MKTTTVNSIKFLKLKRRLALPHWQAVGLMESVWLFCMLNAQDGGIGRHSNEDIAAAIEWDGDADELIRNLVETGWLDEHPEVRLCVHDWEDHAPNFVRGVLAKQGKQFCAAPGELPTLVGNQGKQPGLPTRVSNQSSQPPNLTKPNLTKPNTKNPPTPLRGESPPPSLSDPEPPPAPEPTPEPVPSHAKPCQPEPSPEPLGEPDEEAACAQDTATAVEVMSPEAELAHAWTGARQGVGWRVPSGETYAELLGFFREKLRLGKDPQWVAARIADPGRDRTEKLWQFARRELEAPPANSRREKYQSSEEILAAQMADPIQKRVLEIAFNGYHN